MPTDPNNPLNLDLSPAGQAALAVDLRQPTRDPDMGWNGGSNLNGPGVPLSSLPVDLQNQVAQAQRDWADMDQSYYAPREQDPLPLVLGAAGLIAAPFALSALGIGAGAGAAGAGAATDAAATGGALTAGAAGGAATAGALGGTTLEGLVVTAATQGLSVPAIAAVVGIPAATVSSILSNSGSTLSGNPGSDTVSAPNTVDQITVSPPSNVVDGITVTAPAASGGIDPALLAAGGAGAVGALTGPSDLGAYTGAGVPENVPGPTAGTNAALGDTPLGTAGASVPDQILNWVKANPLQAAALGLTLGGALGGAASGTGSFAVPSGAGTPGTISSLDPRFAASLPPPTQAPRGPAQQLPANFNWNRYAIDNPAQSFFANIPQAQPATFTAPTPDQLRAEGAARLGLPNIDAVKAAFRGPGYAQGGSTRQDFAVHGAGDGRSDSIPARLSDGEYVVDAETVSMLGNGSNNAGARKLDDLRVNLRKSKGHDFAQGRFSVSANAPESYMSGGRV